MKKIRKKANKQDDECISVSEFCKGTGLPEWDVRKKVTIVHRFSPNAEKKNL